MKRYQILFCLFIFIFGLQSCQAKKQTSKIHVLTLNKHIDKADPEYKMCQNFVLKKNDVVVFFEQAKEINNIEFNDVVVLPCSFRGELNINNKKYEYEIKAGGLGYLYNKKSVNKRFICKDKCCKSIPGLC